MSRWVERAVRDDGAQETCANSANSANRGPEARFPGANGTNDTIGTAFLSPVIRAGLAELKRCPVPGITRPQVWPEIVADALRLADEGWAQQALALGWKPVDLWGCSPDSGGNSDHDGLAAVLDGRRIVLLSDRAALIDGGAGVRCLFNRRDMPGAILLWEIENLGPMKRQRNPH